MLTRIFQRYADTIVRHRTVVIVAILAVTGALLSRVGSLQLDNDPDIWAPQNSELIKTTHELENVFGGRNFTVIGVVPKRGDIYRPEILGKIKRIQLGIEKIPEAIKSDILSLAARRIKAIKGTDDGMVVTPMLDPMPRTEPELEKLKASIAENPIYIKSLVAADGKAAAILADFKLPKSNATYAPLYQKIKEIVDRERDDTVAIHLGGQPVEAAWFEFSMAKMPIYFGAAFLIIMAIQYLAFRSLQGMLLPMLTAILSVMWGLGIMALLGIHLDALNTTTPILIMAVATGHSIQILKRYYEELNKIERVPPEPDSRKINRQAVATSILKVGPVMLAAGAIASLAFFSLAISDVAMIRNFGIFAGAGILSAVILELSFIPALRAVLPIRTSVAHGDKSGWLDVAMTRLGHALASRRVSVAILAGVAVAISAALVGTLHLRADNSIKQYSRPDSEVRRDDAVLNSSFGGTDSIAFLVRGPTPDSIKEPAVLRAMDKLQTFLASQAEVGKTQSIVDLIKRMNQAVHRDQPSFNTVPDTKDLIAQYLLLYSTSGDPEDFDNLVDNDYQKAVVWAYLKTDSTIYASDLYARAQKIIDTEFPSNIQVRVGGGLMQTVAINDSITKTKLNNILQMAVVVFLLAALMFRSFVGGLLVTIPLGVIVLANLGIMGWFGIPLDMGTAAITAMVTGIGADYEIYMLYRLREEFQRSGDLTVAMENTLSTSGKAVLFVALSIAGGYAALLVSDFGFYTRLGMTMMTTMLVSALLSLMFLRAVIVVIKPKFILSYGSILSTQQLPEPMVAHK